MALRQGSEAAHSTRIRRSCSGRLLPTLTPDQVLWLSGYLAGAQARTARRRGQGGLAGGDAAEQAAGVATAARQEVTVLYGSQTGNAKRLAEKLARDLQQRSVSVTLSCMSEFKPASLKKAKNLLVLVSTHGEGEPPDKAKLFHEFLHGKRAPRLEGLRYSVLGLGDVSYKEFCQMGKDFDRRLEELGAERLRPRADCDVDYDEAAAAWTEGVLASLGEVTGEGTADPRGTVPLRDPRSQSDSPPLCPATPAASRSWPRSWRISASTAAARTRRPGMSSCCWKVRDWSLPRAIAGHLSAKPAGTGRGPHKPGVILTIATTNAGFLFKRPLNCSTAFAVREDRFPNQSRNRPPKPRATR